MCTKFNNYLPALFLVLCNIFIYSFIFLRLFWKQSSITTEPSSQAFCITYSVESVESLPTILLWPLPSFLPSSCSQWQVIRVKKFRCIRLRSLRAFAHKPEVAAILGAQWPQSNWELSLSVPRRYLITFVVQHLIYYSVHPGQLLVTRVTHPHPNQQANHSF